MNRQQLQDIRHDYIWNHVRYKMVKWDQWNYAILKNIMYRKRPGRGNNESANDCVIMFDTETSKKGVNPVIIKKDGSRKWVNVENHVVAWTISIRSFSKNLVTLYGHKPSELVSCMIKIHESMDGEHTIMYAHNLAYDWVFIRKFIFDQMGFPVEQLNTKSHYPIVIKFENGIIFKDSLILAQRGLEKWALDLGVEHKKAVGKWDYSKIRDQKKRFTPDELAYIENDTLAGVECIDTTMQALNKDIWSIPYTATGIPRGAVQKLAKENGGRELFLRLAADFKQYLKLTMVYHGGYVHGNRYFIDILIDWIETWCYDFVSSYPFVLLAFKYPMEGFKMFRDCEPEDILKYMDEYAFMFKFRVSGLKLKDPKEPMPAFQQSKSFNVINGVIDNGRMLQADYAEIYLTELDLDIICRQYKWTNAECVEVERSYKDYLPRWLTDYIFQLFEDKCRLKGGDKVLYSIAKSKLNSVYGLMVQKCIRDDLKEDYETGEYVPMEKDPEGLYNEYINKRTTVLPYQWGVWCTAYAFHNLFDLGACTGSEDGMKLWWYSDTDSCYGSKWDVEAVERYNQKCKDLLTANGYGPVTINGHEFWLGVAEHTGLEDEYSEFKTQGAKRYCGRCKDDGELHITVAGVPKKGVSCLNNDINEFTPGKVFSGDITGKLTHTYIYTDGIYIDKEGNETGDSIDLTECDYLLDSTHIINFDLLEQEEVEVQVYEEG